MKRSILLLIIFYLTTGNICADGNDETNKSPINISRDVKILAGGCVNYIIGYDYHKKQGYGAGAGFRIGYNTDITDDLELESTYTLTIHESDTTGAGTIRLNAFDINCKYIFLSGSKFHYFASIGWGLDLFGSEEADVGIYSSIPHIGAGTYINIHDKVDLELGVNLHPVRLDIGEDHRPDATYIQFLTLINYNL